MASSCRTLLAMIFVGLWPFCALAGTLYVGEPEQRSNQVIVPIQLESDAQNRVASLNFDFEYDPAVLQIVGVEPGEAASAIDKEVTGNLMEPGAYRVVMMSLQPTSLHSGEVARLVFQRTAPGLEGNVDVAIARTAFSSPEATTIPSQGSEAVIRVTQSGSTPVRGTADVQEPEPSSEDTASNLTSFPPLEDELPAATPDRSDKSSLRSSPIAARSNSADEPLDADEEEPLPDAMKRMARALVRAEALRDMDNSFERRQHKKEATATRGLTGSSSDAIHGEVTGSAASSGQNRDMAPGVRGAQLGSADSTVPPGATAASVNLAQNAASATSPAAEVPAKSYNGAQGSRWLILGIAIASALVMLVARRRLVLRDG